MLFIRGPDQVRRIDDRAVRSLIQLRMSQLGDGEPFDPRVHGELYVVEKGDTAEALEVATGASAAWRRSRPSADLSSLYSRNLPTPWSSAMKSVTSKKSLKSEPAIKSEVTAKPEAIKKAESTTMPEPDVRVLKSATCQSLSGKSKLTYEVGATSSNDPRLRIVGNSGTGSFRQEWVELREIRAALDKSPRDETVTSDCLVPLFRQESANMPGFVWSVLLHEGLVRVSAKQKRRYERVEPEAFDAAVKALMEGKGAPAVDAKSKKTKSTKVAPAKTPRASTKK